MLDGFAKRGTEMSLIEDISADLVNEKASLSNTLRKAKVVRKSLAFLSFGIGYVRSWKEYMIPKDIPKYRKFRPRIMEPFQDRLAAVLRNVACRQ